MGSKTVGKRRRAREMAVQMLYQHELGGSDVSQIFASFDLDGYVDETEHGGGAGLSRAARRKRAEKSFEYARRLVEGTLENLGPIDGRIRRQAENWRLERMPAIDRNILRLAVYEMLFESNVPEVVIVDEAIELAKKFGSESSGRFVNGLLDGILQSRQPAAARPPAPVAGGSV